MDVCSGVIGGFLILIVIGLIQEVTGDVGWGALLLIVLLVIGGIGVLLEKGRWVCFWID